MTIEDILQAEADEVGSVLADHDPEAFTRRLAERIAEAERQTPPPARPRPGPGAPRPGPAAAQTSAAPARAERHGGPGGTAPAPAHPV
ncbi:hypothetical protein TPA0598_07_01820 [Streptomyces lydicamycinicus]|uniref:Uncharacterized protein n=1 Tax=Streptomyces lydicamycinicus TaxID=1546107 RepID=A0A0P4RBR3_9ACTN|nr:hypothetical protein TPA0598_07_01820 [Streptomyces lydicamycinicus]